MCSGIHGSPWYILHRTVGRYRHIGLTCAVVRMESLGYPTYILHREVGRDRLIALTCVVVHGSPWDILPTSNLWQWDGIDT